MVLIALHAALAGAPPNGDFEAMSDWVDESPAGSAAIVQFVQQGTAFGGTVDTTGIVFPSPNQAMYLQGGAFQTFTPAIVSSSEVLVTHTELTWQQYDSAGGLVVKPRFRPTGGVAVELGVAAESVGAFGLGTIDISAHCGRFGLVEFAQNGSVAGPTPFTLLDDVSVQTLCAEYVDSDGDHYCPLGVDVDQDGTCVGPGEALASGELGGDCDDVDPDVNPAAVDVPFDGADQDCTGRDFTPNCFADVDGDGFGAEAIEGTLGCNGSGESDDDTDCDDTRADAFPGALELCNGLDDDCDLTIDPGALVQVWPDRDQDGAGDASSPITEVCGPVVEGVTNGDDCDDGNPFISPTAVEAPGDGTDQDCSGDELCYTDADGDGYGSTLVTGPLDCAGFANRGQDCDDTLADVSPMGIERCNNLDDNCDGAIDEGYGATLYWFDGDGDGFGSDDLNDRLSSCDPPPAGYVEVGGDCDDMLVAVNPDADEQRADGVDQDCDGFEACYTDEDGDGFGTLAVLFDPLLQCAVPPLADDPDDCDDADADVHPGVPELAGNEIDEDCDGFVDPGPIAPPPSVSYRGGACSQASSGAMVLSPLFLVAAAFRRRR